MKKSFGCLFLFIILFSQVSYAFNCLDLLAGFLEKPSVRIGEYSRTFNRVSWMKLSRKTYQRPSWMPEQAGTLPELTAEQFAKNIQELKEGVSNPEHGLFGPDSIIWKVVGINGEPLTFVPMSYLQLAEPVATQGVYERSSLLTDYFNRIRETAKYVYDVIYAPFPQVERIAFGIYKGHSKITGVMPETVGRNRKLTRYRALDPEALLWIHTTRIMAWLEAYDMLERAPLSEREREQFYQESKKFGIIFGIPKEILPETFDDFYAYYQYMLRSDRLAVGSAAKKINEIMSEKMQAATAKLLGAEFLTLQWWAIPPTALTYLTGRVGLESVATGYLPRRFVQDFGLRNPPGSAAITKRMIKDVYYTNIFPRIGLSRLPAYEIALARIDKRDVGAVTKIHNLFFTGE